MFPADDPTLSGFFRHLLHERNLSPHTLRAYQGDLAQFLTQLFPEGLPPGWLASIGVADTRRALAALRAEGISAATLARKLAAVRTFFRYACQEGLIEDEPTRPIRAPKRSRKLPEVLSVDEIDRLLRAPRAGQPFWLRDRAILETLYSTGIRVAELCRLDVADLEPAEAWIRVAGKGSRERLVPIGEPAIAIIGVYQRYERQPLLARAKQPGSLFLSRVGTRLTTRSVARIVERHADAAELSGRVSPHTLRHTFATHMLDRGADIRLVGEMMGHARLMTTQLYTHLARARLADVYRVSHPRGA